MTAVFAKAPQISHFRSRYKVKFCAARLSNSPLKNLGFKANSSHTTTNEAEVTLPLDFGLVLELYVLCTTITKRLKRYPY